MKKILPKRIADPELLNLIRSGKKEGAEKLYDTYGRFLFLVISRIVPERKTAIMVFKATIRKIWNTTDDYAPQKEKFYSWMIRIAKKLASDALTGQKSPDRTI